MPLTGKLRAFNDEVAKKSPNEPGAYELLYKDSIVYIGSSSVSIRSRILAHRQRKKFMKITYFRYRIVEWGDEAIDVEAKLCQNFKKKNGNKPRLQERTPANRSIFDW